MGHFIGISIQNCHSNLAAYVKKAGKAITNVKKSAKTTADIKPLKMKLILNSILYSLLSYHFRDLMWNQQAR